MFKKHKRDYVTVLDPDKDWLVVRLFEDGQHDVLCHCRIEQHAKAIANALEKVKPEELQP